MKEEERLVKKREEWVKDEGEPPVERRNE